MEDFLSKFTLYDVLGYGVPGLLYLSILFLLYYSEIPADLYSYFSGNTVLTIVLVLILSHILGSVMSELGRWIAIFFQVLAKVVSCVIEKINCKCLTSVSNAVRFFLGDEMAFHDNEKEDMVRRVQKAKTVSGLYEVENPNQGNGSPNRENNGQESASGGEQSAENKLSRYDYNVMKADLQTESKYNRIHNYSSSVVMCKNVSVSLLLGAITVSVAADRFQNSSLYKDMIVPVLLFCSFIMLVRAIEFSYKIDKYTREWFINKYLGKKEESGSENGHLQ